MRRGTGPFDPARASDWPAAIGCDEVGLGALCGPVLVAAVWFDPARLDPDLLGALDDSKKLTPRRREALAAALRVAVPFRLAAASVAAQELLGLRGATLAAMARAARGLRRGLGLDAPALIDGLAAPPDLPGARALVRGEREAPQIAAASILAKVARDRLMVRLAARWPGYGWESNVGYGAAAHMAALARLGPTPHHRPGFAPVAAAADAVGFAVRRRALSRP